MTHHRLFGHLCLSLVRGIDIIRSNHRTYAFALVACLLLNHRLTQASAARAKDRPALPTRPRLQNIDSRPLPIVFRLIQPRPCVVVLHKLSTLHQAIDSIPSRFIINPYSLCNISCSTWAFCGFDDCVRYWPKRLILRHFSPNHFLL